MADEEEFALDPATIKVLASDTRIALLRLLRERRRTLTELAAATGLHKATVLEHLERMTEAGLIKRHDDPERIWVYYELTRRGDRLVNPGRTRFFLLMGAAGLAALVAIAIVAGLTSLTPPPDPGSAEPPGPDFDLRAHEGFGTGFTLLADRASPDARDPVIALLVPQALVEDVARGGPGQGYRLHLERQNESVLRLRAPGPVPPGDYALYLRDATGGDNREAMPAVHVANVTVIASHPTWWQGLDGPPTFRVTIDGAPADGRVELMRANLTALALSATGGLAEATVAVLDALPPASYQLRFAPANGTAPAEAGTFAIRAPQVAAWPLEVLVGVPTRLQVSVAAGPSAEPAVHLADGALQRVGANGTVWAYTLTPPAPGPLTLRVGRSLAFPIEAHPYVDLAATTLPGPRLELALEDHLRQPWANVTLALDGTALGTTNATGRLAFPMPAEGDRVLAMALPGGLTVTRALRVAGWNVTDAPPALELVPQAVGAEDLAALDVALRNDQGAAVPVTVLAMVDGRPAAARALDVPAAGEANTTFALPVEPGVRAIAARAEPLAQPTLSFANRTAPPPATPPSPTPPPAPSPPTTPAPSPAPSPTTGGAAGPGFGFAEGGTTETLFSDSAAVLVRASSADSRAEAARLEGVPFSEDLAQRGAAAKTPGFDAALLVAAAALAVLAARRRR